MGNDNALAVLIKNLLQYLRNRSYVNVIKLNSLTSIKIILKIVT